MGVSVDATGDVMVRSLPVWSGREVIITPGPPSVFVVLVPPCTPNDFRHGDAHRASVLRAAAATESFRPAPVRE